ncbi:MAG: efflux RND transporter permease subunit [Aurantimonas endophytica]|uniref:Multidrug efflux pump n=1 Tax=Aurantimonas endophytica TaxID=1522175 RepID=A0A7W6HGZ8_9HYPH|nr:efflux RND transporter permease subunit [Aurantimonas endophytica]MBB4005019.1 multidrug efflux pump [Aurantimonas endophytica]MCO6405825.1 AcrB/AcrD/AcrF family protein [Aurantimonas endophytica]
MNGIIEAAFDRSRTVLLFLVLIFITGIIGYQSIPKESSPDIPIPVMYVTAVLDGISPEDSERLLVRPLETELSSLSGLDEMESHAAEGFASVQLEFEAGFDANRALTDVKDAVDRARPNMPDEVDEPVVNEVNTSLFPILTVVLSGPIPERTLVNIANELQDDLEASAGVLEVDIGGDRDELLEVLIEPTVFETYDLSFDELVSQISRNNRLIAAGAMDTGAGRIVVKVPGLIEDMQDVLDMPVKVDGSTVITFADVAVARRTFEDPSGFARIDGEPSLALEVKKRSGANIIETVAAVREVVARHQAEWPETVRVKYLQDESEQVETMLGDLENNVISAIVLVMIVIVAALGLRTSILVGLSIPGSFLAGIAILWFFGFTMNIIVLFSLILVVGMLVDGAIVTTELADRRLMEGATPREAYKLAAQRMAWPIIASTITTLAVFLPLLFWTGMVGEFMKFLPITVIITLSASLFMALIFIPVLGGLIGKAQPMSTRQRQALEDAETGDLSRVGGATGAYLKVLRGAVKAPLATLIIASTLLVGAFYGFAQYGRGVEFFPSIEPEFAQVQIRARDNFSIYERDALVRRVEDRLLGMEEVRSVYARTIGEGGARQLGADIIGTIQLELDEWDQRRKATEIFEDIRTRVADIPGVNVTVQQEESGPSSGKPINVKLLGSDMDALAAGVATVRGLMDDIGGFENVTDSRPLPGVEWQVQVDREEAARYGADVSLLGQAVRLLTVGIEVSNYRPDDAGGDGEVPIRVRFPAGDRTLERLEDLRIRTAQGLVPIRNFVSFEPAPKVGTIIRIDQRRVMSVEADVAPGVLANDQTVALNAALAAAELPPGIDYTFGGEAEDQAEAATFLAGAAGAAIFLMFIVLVTQFNSIYQAFLVMTAIVFSTAGVFYGLLLTGRPFGVVMGGIGVIALAGIVVNNNIVLIDTYNDLRRAGQSPLEAVMRTGAQRLRPVFLTSITTVLGLVPMVIGANVDFIRRDIAFGSPSTQWWIELSTAIAGGLTFATVLTLVLTPALLILGETFSAWVKRRRGRNAPSPLRDDPLAEGDGQPTAAPAE